MPWQSAGAMTVIIAMFNVVPLLVGGIQYLGHGVSNIKVTSHNRIGDVPYSTTVLYSNQ